MSQPWVLGISASHNGAYCLLHGRDIRVAIQEERLTGVKRARVYGARRGLGLCYCLETAGITAADLSMVVLSCQRAAGAVENDVDSIPELRSLARRRKRLVSHHLAHAVSAFALSGFDHSAVLVVDGQGSPVGDLDHATRQVIEGASEDAWEHLSLFRACRGVMTPVEVHTTDRWIDRTPNGMWPFFTLGGMYSAVAQQIFGDPMEAGKVMGLAPFGVPSIATDEFVRFEGPRLIFPNLVQRRFQHDGRWPKRQRGYQNLAASVQRAIEVSLLRIAARLHLLTDEANLCMAGGVALNSVANQRICAEAAYDQVFVVPSAEDSGVAVGAAYVGLWELEGWAPRPQVRRDGHGRTSTDAEIERAIGAVPDVAVVRPRDWLAEVADRLTRGEIGGWFQGGAELGPRALGQRSVLCSPCPSDMKRTLNAQVKFREAFRPFAPSVLAERAEQWFDFGASSPDSPFMLRVVPFRIDRRAQVPAVVHVDGTGRLQTLTAEDNRELYELVARFHARTGVPMLLNTSFNVRGEPIVETPADALWCLLGTGLDFCVIHDWIVTKASSFRHLLNYVPRVAGEAYTLHMAVRDGALETSLSRDDAMTLRTSTPWGTTDFVVPLRLVRLLAAIDGRRTGRELQEILSERPTAASLTHDLLLLRRMHAIQLCARDVSDH